MDQQDLLTCGDCQLVFALSDIVAFVRHKQTTCHRDVIARRSCSSGAAVRRTDYSSEPEDAVDQCRDIVGSDVDDEELRVVDRISEELRASSSGIM